VRACQHRVAVMIETVVREIEADVDEGWWHEEIVIETRDTGRETRQNRRRSLFMILSLPASRPIESRT
jgi:hypothetical protein